MPLLVFTSQLPYTSARLQRKASGASTQALYRNHCLESLGDHFCVHRRYVRPGQGMPHPPAQDSTAAACTQVHNSSRQFKFWSVERAIQIATELLALTSSSVRAAKRCKLGSSTSSWTFLSNVQLKLFCCCIVIYDATPSAYNNWLGTPF